MAKECLTVAQVNAYIKRVLEYDNNLQDIYIRGEISNYIAHRSGHSYFTLKDEESQIPAVMFRGKKQSLEFTPQNGMKVIIKGSINVYEPNGKYQLIAETMTEDGVGNLYIAFEQLKKKLKAEGLFDEEHKKELPKYPERIGVVTAATGAAIRDIIRTMKERYPYCKIILFPSLVNGAQSAPDIVRQIKHAQQYDIDTLIVGRGGGSIEDLWGFNEEIVARAIYDCEIPVISAVGHEIDFTISDFVADKRAPTPTGAVMIAVQDADEVKYKISQLNRRLNKDIDDLITQNRTRLDNISQKKILKDPESIYEIKGMQLDNLVTKLEFTSKNIIKENRNRLSKLENKNILKNPQEIIRTKREQYLRNFDKLNVLNPLLTLKRGYTLAKAEGKVVSSAKDVKSGDKLDIEFNDGVINTRVI